MKTSAIITVYNRPDLLEACIRALELNTARVDEIVVSDDGSGEDAVNKMKAFFKSVSIPVKHIRQKDEGYRLAAARNNAIRHSSGDYLISLDCDIMMLPDAVGIHLNKAKRGCFLAANRAFLDAALSDMALSAPLSKEILENLWGKSDKSHLRKVFHQFQRNRLLRKLKLARRHKPKLIGCHFSLFREDAERINGFDEHYVGWGLEDDDFSLRLHKAGIEGKSIILEARAMHLHHDSVDSRPKTLSESRNMSYFKRPNIPAYCATGLTKLSDK